MLKFNIVDVNKNIDLKCKNKIINGKIYKIFKYMKFYIKDK